MRAIERHRPAQRSRGAASLAAVLLLAIAVLLALAYANRGLLLEARMATNQQRSAQAFEAAEAGLDWAWAQLNDRAAVGSDCRPGTGAVDDFLTRQVKNVTGAFAPRTWSNAGTAVPLQPACIRTTAGWACHCPTDRDADLSAQLGDEAQPAFRLQFEAGGRPGLIRLVSSGCSSLAAPCSATGRADATARVESLLAWQPAMPTVPAAPLVARGHIDAGTAALGLRNDDGESGGVAVQAGDAITAPAARIASRAGQPGSSAQAERDPALAGLDADAFFVTWFGSSRAAWARRAGVSPVACSGNCAGTLQAAIGQARGRAALWVGGTVEIEGPVTLGSAAEPVLLVADGPVRLRGAVQVHGVIYGRGIRWDAAAAPSAQVHGALVSETDYAGDAAADLVYDPAVLAALRRNVGEFVRVAGSWRDY